MALYGEWKVGKKIGSHQIMALLSSYHIGQITAQEALAIMDHFGLSDNAKNEMQALYNKLDNGTLSRAALDNALMLGEKNVPGFENEANFKAKLGL